MQSTVSLDRYIQQVRAIPKLSREEEHELALRVGKGDQDAADRLVEANLRYVIAIALQYRRYGVTLGDLIAEGSVGLVTAVRKFDPHRGTRFVTYAGYWIRAFVLEAVVDILFDRGHDGVDLLRADRPLPAGSLQALADLLALERFAKLILLDHGQRHPLVPLVRRVAPPAIETLPAAADRHTVLAGARIGYLVVIGLAIGALHQPSPPRQEEMSGTAVEGQHPPG